MTRSALICSLFLCLLSGIAQAGFILTPHLSEYDRLAPGSYLEANLIHTHIEDIYNRDGERVKIGSPALPAGEFVNATLLQTKWLWIGESAENNGIPLLQRYQYFFRAILTAGWQEASPGLQDVSRLFGLRTQSAGLGDLFLLAGLYSDDHRLGPLHYNAILAATVKVPIGEYNEDTLLNMGTNYWTLAPIAAFHFDLGGRLLIDAAVSYQKNFSNDRPGYGGLVPSQAADVYTVESNFAWKFNEKFYMDLGLSWRQTNGPNTFANPSINRVDQPLPAMGTTTPRAFYIEPVAGVYQDGGVNGLLATAGFYYIYRSSAVLNFRVAVPLRGKGSQFTLPFDVFTCGVTGVSASNACPPPDPGAVPIAQVDAELNGVQEAAAIPASMYFEARLVFLPWAP